MKGTNLENKASATAVPTDYCGNMIYENGVLKKVFFDGGYVTVTGTLFYFYYLKDHQGNNRVVVNPDGSSGQVNHYYPFGGLFGESTGNAVQPYKYNGKELDRTHGLDWYDYGARHLAPDASRFTTIDPMAEKYYHLSPYAYCANNPVRYIDLRGDTITYINENVMYTYQTNNSKYGFYDGEGNLYTGNNSYMNSLSSALDKIREGEIGNSLVNYLIDNGNVSIFYAKDNSADIDGGKYITWNDKSQNGGYNLDGTTNRPAYIGLSHELAHIADRINGTADYGAWVPGNYDTGIVEIPKYEQFACFIENLVRMEHKVPLRSHYSITFSGKPFEPSRIVDKNGHLYKFRPFSY